MNKDSPAVNFTVDARLIEQLGEQLVTSDLMALGELVKNAYDADASYVDICYEELSPENAATLASAWIPKKPIESTAPGNPQSRDSMVSVQRRAPPSDDPAVGYISIEDDGNGMDLPQLIRGWMHIGTSEKVRSPESPRYGRARSGRKGVGRFAAHRLGSLLRLTTTVRGSTDRLSLFFRWSDYRAGTELSSIRQSVEHLPAKNAEHGTKLEILHTRRHWTQADLLEVLVDLTRLYCPPRNDPKQSEQGQHGLLDNPSQADIQSTTEDEKPTRDPGFEVLAGYKSDKVTATLNDTDALHDERVMRIRGVVDEDGRGRYYLDFFKPQAPSKEVAYGADGICLSTGPLSFDFNLFIFSSAWIDTLGVRRAQAIGRSRGGARIRRDGFMIQPYGLGEDDWLGIEAHVAARRKPLNMWRNQQIFGEVALGREANPQFVDLLTRHGMIDTPQLQELRRFVFTGLEVAANEHESLKVKNSRKKRKASTPSAAKAINDRLGQFRNQQAPTADGPDPTDGVVEQPSDVSPPERAGSQTDDSITLTPADQAELVDLAQRAERAQIKEIQMLRVLASLGTGLAVFGHEFKGIGTSLAVAAVQLDGLIQQSTPPLRDQIEKVHKKLRHGLAILQTYSVYIEDFVSSQARTRRSPIELETFCKRFSKTFEPLLASKSAELIIDVPPTLATTPVHEAEMTSVLFNLVTNALKAVMAPGHERRILFKGRRRGSAIDLTVADSGCGIPDGIGDEIFEPFVSRLHNPDDDRLGRGTGLGLYIVSEILTQYHGAISIVDPPSGYRTALRVTIPAKG